MTAASDTYGTPPDGDDPTWVINALGLFMVLLLVANVVILGGAAIGL